MTTNPTSLVQDLSAWIERGSGVTLDPQTAAALAHQVRGLARGGYTLPAIRWGLAIWAIDHLTIPSLPVGHLDRITHRFSQERSAKARKWREEQRARVGAFGAGALWDGYAARRSLQAA